MVRQQRDVFYFLVIGQRLLQRIDTFFQHIAHFATGTEVFPAGKRYVVVAGPLLDQPEFGHDQGRDKLISVGNYSYLIDVFIYQHHRFDHLRGDVFAVAGLEKVLDAVGKIELSVFQIPRIAGSEEAVGIENRGIKRLALVITAGDCRTFEQDFVVFSNLNLNAFNGPSH